MDTHKIEKKNTNPPTRGNVSAGAWDKWLQMGSKKKHKAAGAGVNGSKWTHTKQMKAQIRRRGGMAPLGAWVKWLQKGYIKKTEPPARGKTGVPSKVKTIWRGSTFFSKSLRTRGSLTRREGGPERVREGVRRS